MKKRLIGEINKRYVELSMKLSENYAETYGLFCDIYYPKSNKSPNKENTYQNTNIYEPVSKDMYDDEPTQEDQKYVIVNLFKKENVNSPENEFDSFYMDGDDRPFIETIKARELPDLTKVVVKIQQTQMFFYVDRKTVINGANGHFVLRMYLNPLAQ